MNLEKATRSSNSATSPELFTEGRITVGLVLPLRETPEPRLDYRFQLELARHAENAGIHAIWVRDVPLNGDWYPENFGHLDPFVMLAAIAATTSRITLGTAAIVLPLRHPLHVAKAAASLQTLSGGRLILGLGSGDREEEYSAFGEEIDERRTLFRSHWERLASALATQPRIIPDLPNLSVDYTMHPAVDTAIPMIAVGSGGQTLGWIARHAAGWATYHREPEAQKDRYGLWRQATSQVAPEQFRSFSQALRIELVRDRDAGTESIELGYRTGINGLVEVMQELRIAGVHHAMLSLVPTGRPIKEQISEIGDILIPAITT